ncbi:MAG: transposase [Planctomycetota bacterium]|nr:transposase [Planctomycetota bacterium]
MKGGNIVSDSGVPLIAEVDRMFRVLQRYAECFTDHRDQELIEHSVLDLVRQRIYGLCLGYEDVIDHDLLRADPLIAACVGKQDLEGQLRRREADRGMPIAQVSGCGRHHHRRQVIRFAVGAVTEGGLALNKRSSIRNPPLSHRASSNDGSRGPRS